MQVIDVLFDNESENSNVMCKWRYVVKTAGFQM